MTVAFGLIGTVVIFYASKWLYARYEKIWLSPLLICPLILVIILLTTGTSYAQYNSGADILSTLLGPATVAFAVPMYKNYALLKKNALAIFASLLVGCIVAIVSSLMLALAAGLNNDMINSLVPRSITTPIAMDISTIIGGDPTMTAVFVIVTGLTGSIVGPIVIRTLRFRRAASKGLLLGMGAHGCGTSKAFEFGELEGTFSSLAMIVAALVSIILSETFFPYLAKILLS
ncbi:LrgB family protein [Kurthia huakuii]|uniref:LrgB family protein n=1 Tax=Kurthia huakuii TaxID=1421019 RepID=UPI000495C55A|nr:LrgB family protein [Kurthia huakuii]MBM7699320.1 putative murein hydrolase (TIGR00659 family) [Kurthia huakuii]